MLLLSKALRIAV